MKSVFNYLALLTLIIVLPFASHGQNPVCNWGKSFSGPGPETALVTNKDGSVYFAGYFATKSLSFDSITLHLSNQSSPVGTYPDIFVAKYDASGNAIWARKSDGAGNVATVTKIASDPEGNVVVTGTYYLGSISFGNITLNNPGPSYYDIFVVKYDSAGNVLWAKSAGGAGQDGSTDIATDENGNIYVTGSFEGASMTFGSITLNSTAQATAFGYSDNIFIVKYDPAGNVLWAKNPGGSMSNIAFGITTNLNGDVFITGNFLGNSLDFGSLSLPSTGGSPLFIVKLDAMGNPVWGKSIEGANGPCSGNKIVTDTSGNIYVTGSFASDSLNFDNTTLTCSGSNDIFLMKADASGQILWAKSAGGADIDLVGNLGLDAMGNIYLSGYFLSPVLSFGAQSINRVSDQDIFVAKYNAQGGATWAKGIPTGFNPLVSVSQASAIDSAGNIYLAGQSGNASLALDTVTITNPVYPGYFFYLTKFTIQDKDGGGGGDDTTNSIAQNDFNNQFKIYPVPSNGNIILSGNFSNENPVIVNIFNLEGKKVFSRKMTIEHAVTLNLDLASGVYFLKLKTKQGQVTRKFVLKK